MSVAATKKHFSTVAALRHFTPAVLAEFLHRFPGYLKQKNLTIPPAEAAEFKNMPYDDIRAVCMAEDIDPELNRILFMATQLGDEQGWTLIQEELEDRQQAVSFDPKHYTHHDLPVVVWLRRKSPAQEDILEQSYARMRIHAKSAYRYYAPFHAPRAKFEYPNKQALQNLRRDIAMHITNDPNNPDVKVIDYDYTAEVWFLIRYPGQPVRPDAVKNGEEEDVSYTPGQYDAVVFHKTYGDLRMNTIRKKEQVHYRTAFGHALFGETNVFDPKKKNHYLGPAQNRMRPPFRHDRCWRIPSLSAGGGLF